MRATITVVTPRRAHREDTVVEAPAATPSGELVVELARLVEADQAAPLLLDGAPLEPMTPLAASGLRDGAILSFGETGADPEPNDDRRRNSRPRGYLELRVVNGPAAGTIHQLPLGTTTIGRGSSCDVVLDDADVSRRHAVLTVTTDAITVADAGSTNGTRLDGVEVGQQPIAIAIGARLRLGESTLSLSAPDEPPVALVPASAGRLAYNRPPRLVPPQVSVRVEFPARPQERPPARLPIIATIAPLFAGVVLALVMRRPEYLLFTVLSPLMMAGQWLADRMGHRRASRVERATYETALRKAEAELAAALATEAAARRSRAPDPAALRKIATAPSTRLWERRQEDTDFLQLRLGGGTLPADVQLANAGDVRATVDDVPVTVALGAVGVLGVAGPAERAAALARSLISQLAALHSPRDLGIVLLTEPARAQSWEWVRWLPHLRPTVSATCQALVGLDRASVAARVAELVALVDARQPANSGPAPRRAIVVLVDGARAMRDTAGLSDVLSRGPDVDVLAICLDSGESSLPEECGAVATFVGETATRLTVQTSRVAAAVEAIADGVSVVWSERVARALAPLQDATGGAGGEGLPDAVRWLELAGLESFEDAGIRDELQQRWLRSRGGSTAALLGVGASTPVIVDIARDGPHALVAGTTGSGKSELLQTLVAALAVANRPDELTFVLVDYKGGAAFGACAALPHTIGLVTDLDGNLVERALISLTAELKRRETLLAAAGAPDIEKYREAGNVMARLVIVVDEFASLAEELPDFVGGLVGIAQRGRSLGVHLVLATQRPEGVVSADIRANTNLRICLAVMHDAESRDVIDTPDAARISRATPGRGYLRTGHGDVRAFQSGRVGGANRANSPERIAVKRSPFQSLAAAPPLGSDDTAHNGSKTDLDLIVEACSEAAIRLAIATPASPWLAPLPDVIASADAESRPLTATLGVRDVPAHQAREPYRIDLASTGHLVVAGSARSGRSTALRTLGGLLARSTATADLHMYVLDCGGGGLGSLAALPHVGAVVLAHEPDRARRLISMLVVELARRQEALATRGFGSIGEQRATDPAPLPHVVVLVDGWEMFVAAFDDVGAGAIVDGAFRLLREGASVGIHVVVSSDHAGLVGRLASTVDNRLVLRLADRGDYALIGIPARAVPAHLPPGRGFLAGDLAEIQVCLLDRDPSGAAQLAALARIADQARARDAHLPRECRPRRVDPLPERITLPAITSCPLGSAVALTHENHRPGRIVLGVGGDEIDAISVDLLEAGPGFVIAGPPRSGRSTTLATIAVGLRSNGWRVIAVTARPSPITARADHAFDATDSGFEAVIHGATQPLAILVDDAELATDTPAAAVLDRLVRTARDAGHVVAIAGTTEDLSVGFRGFLVEARRSRSGVLLTPRGPFDGEALGIRLPRDTNGHLPPGRGLLVSRGSANPIQIALPQ